MSNYILVNGTLYHHGIKGQKWGERRFQNEDGSLTPEGRERYGYGKKSYTRKEWKKVKEDMNSARYKYAQAYEKRNKKDIEKAQKNLERKEELYRKAASENAHYRDKGELGELIYETNTKRAKNAYVKSKIEYDKLANKGNDYVERKMKEEFGKDYEDWKTESEVVAAVAVGATTAAMYAAMIYWASKVYS